MLHCTYIILHGTAAVCVAKSFSKVAPGLEGEIHVITTVSFIDCYRVSSCVESDACLRNNNDVDGWAQSEVT